MNDWKGIPITEHEPSHRAILVWEISPHPTEPGDYDSCLERGYQRATELAQLAVANAMDSSDEQTLRDEGVTVVVKLREMRLDEYGGVEPMIEFSTQPRYTVFVPAESGMFEERLATDDLAHAILTAKYANAFIRDSAIPALFWSAKNGWAPWTQTVEPAVRVVMVRRLFLDLDPEECRVDGIEAAAERALAKARREGKCLDEETLTVSEVVR